MFIAVMAFLGHVFCFWLLWKGLDYGYHQAYPVRKKINPQCVECVHQSYKVDELEERFINTNADLQRTQGKVDELNSKIKKLHEEVNFYKRMAPTLVDFLNRATMDELIAIPNIGKVKASRIAEKRPYRSPNDLYKAINPNDMAYIQRYFKRKFTYGDSSTTKASCYPF